MSFGVERSVQSQSVPIWQGTGKDIQLAQGGFALNATGLPKNTVLPAGSLVLFDEAARTATVYGSGTLQAAATGGATTTYKVNKGHSFKVGDNLAFAGAGGKAFAITVIDTTSSTDYDNITVGTTIGDGALGAWLYASTGTGATASAYPAANGILYDDTFGNVGESVSAVIRGTIYARRMPAYSAGIAALTGLKNITFSQSK